MSKLKDLARAEAEKRAASGSGIATALEAMYPHDALQHYRKGGFIAGATWSVSRVTEEQIETVIREASVEHYHSEYGYGLFTTDLDQIVEKVAALYQGEAS